MKELDKRFIGYLSPRLQRFHWERENVANFRCPLCGDSKKSMNKARGYFFFDPELDQFRFKCHNCGECDGWTFRNWLSNFDSIMFEEYNLESFKETSSGRERLTPLRPQPKLNQTARIVKREAVRNTNLLGQMVSIDNLADDHFAKRYVINRAIPTKFHSLLYFTKNYKEDIKDFETDQEVWAKQPEDERLVIPFWTGDGRLKAVQGRSFDNNASLRYITAKPNTSDTKIYGEDRLVRGKTSMVVEGPIDSLFLPNCLATADADLLNAKVDIYIPDNQYRNRSVCGIIDKIIKARVKVVLFPPSVQWKDINDMVDPKKGNMNQQQLFQLIGSNVYQGMAAELRFADLRKA